MLEGGVGEGVGPHDASSTSSNQVTPGDSGTSVLLHKFESQADSNMGGYFGMEHGNVRLPLPSSQTTGSGKPQLQQKCNYLLVT
jgi:hypothetical protein